MSCVDLYIVVWLIYTHLVYVLQSFLPLFFVSLALTFYQDSQYSISLSFFYCFHYSWAPRSWSGRQRLPPHSQSQSVPLPLIHLLDDSWRCSCLSHHLLHWCRSPHRSGHGYPAPSHWYSSRTYFSPPGIEPEQLANVFLLCLIVTNTYVIIIWVGGAATYTVNCVW